MWPRQSARSAGSRGRPVREIRTPVNGGNRPSRDNGEGVGRHSLTHFWDRRYVPWEAVTHYGWQDQIVLAVHGMDHRGADTELHVRVPWKLRGTVEELMASKVPMSPSAERPGQDGVAGPQQPWRDAVRPQTRGRDSFVALFTALVLFFPDGRGPAGRARL